MSDIRNLLDRTARPSGAKPPVETVEADLRRGRAAAARQRRRRTVAVSVAGTCAAAVIAGTTIAVGDLGGSHGATGSGSGSSEATGRASAVRLVAYTGEQPDGFLVGQVPSGWRIQGSNPARLTIAPVEDTSHPDAFTGKLVVTLLSSSARQELPRGDKVTVGEDAGVVTHQTEADVLTYEDSEGHLVQVQAWRSALGWSNQQLVRFATGVTATSDVVPGVG